MYNHSRVKKEKWLRIIMNGWWLTHEILTDSGRDATERTCRLGCKYSSCSEEEFSSAASEIVGKIINRKNNNKPSKNLVEIRINTRVRLAEGCVPS